MWKDLLVHVDGTTAGRRRAEFSAALAEQFDARLTGLHITPPVDVPPVYRGRDVEVAAQGMERRKQREAEVSQSTFEDVVGHKPLRVRWRYGEGEMVQRMCEYARYTDLFILGQYESAGSAVNHPLPLASSIVLHCGRPILIVPANWSSFTSKPKVLVAWDGSREAVRAVHDALPLLKIAGSIIVLSISSERGRIGADEADTELVVDHLRQHGVSATVEIASGQTNTESNIIKDRIDKGEFQLLVMGAYSHPRWFEFIFGGVTQSVMLSAPLPVLLSH